MTRDPQRHEADAAAVPSGVDPNDLMILNGPEPRWKRAGDTEWTMGLPPSGADAAAAGRMGALARRNAERLAVLYNITVEDAEEAIDAAIDAYLPNAKRSDR